MKITKRKPINRIYELLANKSLVDRRGGHPKHLSEGPAGLSERVHRKATVAAHISAKVARRKSQ